MTTTQWSPTWARVVTWVFLTSALVCNALGAYVLYQLLFMVEHSDPWVRVYYIVGGSAFGLGITTAAAASAYLATKRQHWFVLSLAPGALSTLLAYGIVTAVWSMR